MVWTRVSNGTMGFKDLRISTALIYGTSLFKLTRTNTSSTIADPYLTAAKLLSYILSTPRDKILRNRDVTIDASLLKLFYYLVSRVSTGEPVAYVVGYAEFWSLQFAVNKYTLIPRPESELLINVATRTIKSCHLNGGRILDLGTGSGCLLISILSELDEKWTGVGVDCVPETLNVARVNATNLNLHARCSFVLSNWTEKVHGTFEFIVCNPPYVSTSDLNNVHRYEPCIAFDGGRDGMCEYKRIAANVDKVLKYTGFLVLEVGYNQSEQVKQIFFQQGKFKLICEDKDHNGIIRSILFQRI